MLQATFRSRFQLIIKQMKSTITGFSMIELLVVMAIIAVLLAMVAFGISISQRNSRDSQRSQIAAKIRIAVEEYNSLCGRYPNQSDFVLTSAALTIQKPVSSSCNTIVIPLSGPTSGANSITASGTKYAYSYSASDDNYIIAVGLENGGWDTKSSTTINPTVPADAVIQIGPVGGSTPAPTATPRPTDEIVETIPPTPRGTPKNPPKYSIAPSIFNF